MNMGLKIRALRAEKGMTQENLAEATDLSTRTIQRIENGEVEPRAQTLKLIAKALNVDFDVFHEKNPDEIDDEKKLKENIWLAAIHLSGIFLLILPTIMLWHSKKDSLKGITLHFRDVIIFQLSCWLGFILPGLFIWWMADKPHVLIIGLIMCGIWSTDNAVKAFNNKPYRYAVIKQPRTNDKKEEK